MELSPGTILGPYRIEAPVGAGGMGAVYRARDTRLDRTVAIKTVEGRFSERFEREAKTIASLNHPHICTLFDVGENYLVMEYIEGATLKGPLPLADVIKYGAQIAEALDAAHRKGITHRDLKPGNILITKAGAKVIDFGLAKAAPVARTDNDLTLTKALTGEGTILGTVPYMSPEQLQGHEADARSDIFALGCVLYEMVTGKRAFDGKSQVSIMAAILEHEPAPINESVVPAWLDRLIRRCLRKSPDERWQNSKDVAIELREVRTQSIPLIRTNRAVVVTLSSLAVVASLVAAWAWFRTVPSPARAYTFVIPGPRAQTIFPAGSSISPDGRWVTYLSLHDGYPQLWLHSTERGEARPLGGTESGSYPFWSPDSASVGFFANGKLKRHDLSGDRATVLCDAPSGRGGTWGEDRQILFAPGIIGPLWRVAETGGTPVAVTSLDPTDPGMAHRFPVLLPGGRKLLYVIFQNRKPTGLYVAELGTDGRAMAPRLLIRTVSNVAFIPESADTGHILWVDDDDRALRAQPFRISDASLMGGVTPVTKAASPGLIGIGNGFDFSVSRQGSLLVGSQPREQRPVRVVDRAGRSLFSLATSVNASFSPNGQKLALGRGGEGAGVWIHDLPSISETRFTFSVPGRAQNGATWSPDGKALYYIEGQIGNFALRSKALAGGEETIIGHLPIGSRVNAISPDQKFLLLSRASLSWDLWVWPLSPGGQPSPYLDSSANEVTAAFSPDGHWVAYDSDESGVKQVYVRPFTGERANGAKWQISTLGGGTPRWAGNEIFYLALDGKLMSARVRTEKASITAVPPQVVLDSEPSHGAVVQFPRFDVTTDGTRFVLATPPTMLGVELKLCTSWSMQISAKGGQ